MPIMVTCVLCACGSLMWYVSMVTAFNKNDIYRKPIPPAMQRDRSTIDGLRGQELYTNGTIDEIILKSMGGIWNAAGILFRGNKIQSELDMMLPRRRFFRLYGLSPRLQGARRKKRKSLRDATLRWPNAVVPYSIVDGHYDDREMFWLNHSLTQWEKYTCIRFRQAGPDDRNYVKFQSGDGCYTDVGMAGGEQVVNLERPTCRWKAIYLHMLGHVLGLVHEHQVPNRDRYLSVSLEHANPSWRLWLQKYSKGSLSRFKIRYDPLSIMHYGEKAFSKDGHAVTMELKNKSSSITLGKVWRQELSFSDVKLVNLLYKCRANCTKNITCSRGGFVTDACQCLCPDGTSDCQVGKKAKSTDPKDGGKIVPCVNSLGNDWRCFVWANQGECKRNRDWMKTHCQKSCHMCTADKVEKKEPNLSLAAVGLSLRVWNHHWNITEEDLCKDLASVVKCREWAARGDCLTNTDWMNRYCQRSCLLCDHQKNYRGNCINDHLDDGECKLWAVEGECQINRIWMMENCRKACRACRPDDRISFERRDWDVANVSCLDKSGSSKCMQWKKRGECEDNDRWMTYNCRKTCGRCEDGGCKNLYADYDCEKWKTELSECEKRPSWMRKFCKLSCGHCKPGKGETTPIPYKAKESDSNARTSEQYSVIRQTSTTAEYVEPCIDKYQEASCKRWAAIGHCQINVGWMSINCRKSCGFCRVESESLTAGECVDNNPDCDTWARGGYCQINPGLMLRSCRKACNKCRDGCVDTNSMCSIWGNYGYCSMTPGPMYTHCPKTCGIC
ncbi:zinc metalloproteinase nas-32-like [Liolophura sinensis]|uniref:zinc metalloproteinase nas-32-like n=1 Tax=Liolophura sinensis TaxID=3198878 RepID=UPI003158FF39